MSLYSASIRFRRSGLEKLRKTQDDVSPSRTSSPVVLSYIRAVDRWRDNALTGIGL